MRRRNWAARKRSRQVNSIPESDLDAARIAVNQAVPDVKAAESVIVQATLWSIRRRSTSSTP